LGTVALSMAIGGAWLLSLFPRGLLRLRRGRGRGHNRDPEAAETPAAGLLDGKRTTMHWYHVDELREKHSAIRYVADWRFAVDRGVATTTGITASMPIMLTLIEAIASREKAQTVVRDLGLPHWDAS
jgi:hypothetical protein